MVHGQDAAEGSGSSLKVVALAAAIVLLGVSAFVLPVADWALDLVGWVQGLGLLGVLLYVAVYAIATTLLVPGSLLTIGAGFVYGIWGGVAVVLPGSMLGAMAAFLLGRSAAREWIGGKVKASPRLRAVDDAIGERAFSVIFLLRLSPLVPFTLLNYVLGMTRARFRDYVLASATGMLPGIFLYVYLGSIVTSTAALVGGDGPESGVAGRVLLYGGVVATAVATVFVSRIAKKKLDQQIGSPQ